MPKGVVVLKRSIFNKMLEQADKESLTLCQHQNHSVQCRWTWKGKITQVYPRITLALLYYYLPILAQLAWLMIRSVAFILCLPLLFTSFPAASLQMTLFFPLPSKLQASLAVSPDWIMTVLNHTVMVGPASCLFLGKHPEWGACPTTSSLVPTTAQLPHLYTHTPRHLPRSQKAGSAWQMFHPSPQY